MIILSFCSHQQLIALFGSLLKYFSRARIEFAKPVNYLNADTHHHNPFSFLMFSKILVILVLLIRLVQMSIRGCRVVLIKPAFSALLHKLFINEFLVLVNTDCLVTVEIDNVVEYIQVTKVAVLG